MSLLEKGKSFTPLPEYCKGFGIQKKDDHFVVRLDDKEHRFPRESGLTTEHTHQERIIVLVLEQYMKF